MKEYSAGAIIYTKIEEEIYYLLILDFHDNWGFPKGHLEKDETFREAAIREIKEEVGIDINLVGSFKSELIYKMPNGNTKQSLYYIGTYADQTPCKQVEEVKEIKLLKYADALELLTFRNMKKALVNADLFIRSLN